MSVTIPTGGNFSQASSPITIHIETNQPKKEVIHSNRQPWEIKKDLQPILDAIDREKTKQLAISHLTRAIKQEFLEEIKSYPWTTAAKASLVGIAVLALHPLLLGSIACLNTYRVGDWNDLYSSDINIANPASQLYANAGHGPAYLVEGMEWLVLTSCFLFRSSYKKAVYKIIEKISYFYIDDSSQPLEERTFLYEKLQRELEYYV